MMIAVTGPAGSMGSFPGPVFRPGDDGYDAERAGFNLTVDHHPELIVGAAGPRTWPQRSATPRRAGWL